MSNGPLIKDEIFFNSLNIEIPEMKKACDNFLAGQSAVACKQFADYVRKSLDINKVFSAYSISPSEKPSEESFEKANAALEYNLCSVGVYHKFEDGAVDWYSNPMENKYEEWTWQFSRHYQLLDIALVYAYTKDEKYACRTVELIQSWIKQAVRPEEGVDGHATLCWRTLDTGIRLIHWARIISLIITSPSVTDEFLIDFSKSVIEQADRLTKQCTDANWLITEMHGLYISSLLFPFLNDSKIWREFAKKKLLEAIKAQSLPDGTHCELTFGYQSVSCSDFARTYRIGQIFNDKFPEEYFELIRAYLHTFIKVMAPDNSTPNLNDGYLEDVKSFVSGYKDLFPGDKLINAVADGRIEEEPPSFTSLLFENAGIAVMRSGWEKDAIYGIFDGGKYGKCHNHENLIRCHQHEDKLNFLMWVGQKNVVCESMNYAYDTSKMRAYSRASEGHNTILINCRGQNRFITNHWDESTANTVEPICFESTEEYDISSAIYDEGFGEKGEPMAEHKRTVLFVKKPHLGKPFYVIKDEISSGRENDLTVIWHYNTETLTLTDFGCKCDELTTFFTGGGESCIYCGSEDPFAGWRSVSVKPPIYVPSPVVHYNLRAKDTCFYTVFVPNDNLKVCPVVKVEQSILGISLTFCDGKKIDINL